MKRMKNSTSPNPSATPTSTSGCVWRAAKPSSASAISHRISSAKSPFVDLPAVGVRFDAGSDFGTVESLKSVNQLYMPIPGEVVAVNEELESTPTLVNVSPYGEGWMIRIRPDASAESLLDAAGYRALLGL